MKISETYRNEQRLQAPAKKPEVEKPEDPEDPFVPEEVPILIPDEESFETPPPEMPPPGEGP